MKFEEIINLSEEKKFIWINKKEFKKEDDFIKKIKKKNNNKINIKPILFLEKNSVEFFINKFLLKEFLLYYHFLMYYEEWGVIKEKPIIFMEIKTKNYIIKSKKPFKIKEILKIMKENKEIKLNIYYETTIQGDPEKEEYNILLSYLGGMYNIINNEINELSKKILENCYETAKTAKCLKENKQKWKIFKY